MRNLCKWCVLCPVPWVKNEVVKNKARRYNENSLTIAVHIFSILICTYCRSRKRERDFCQPFRRPLDTRNSSVRMHLYPDRIYYWVSFLVTFSWPMPKTDSHKKGVAQHTRLADYIFFKRMYSCKQNVWGDKNVQRVIVHVKCVGSIDKWRVPANTRRKCHNSKSHIIRNTHRQQSISLSHNFLSTNWEINWGPICYFYWKMAIDLTSNADWRHKWLTRTH